jgi:hypothetical protein
MKRRLTVVATTAAALRHVENPERCPPGVPELVAHFRQANRAGVIGGCGTANGQL